MKMLMVGGSFDVNGGRPSGLFRKISQAVYEEITKREPSSQVNVVNGGKFEDLNSYLDSCVNYDAVFWMPNVPDNDLPKLRDVKAVAPYTMLINSKRNNGEYSFQELVNRSLGVKANLTIEFSKSSDSGPYRMMVFDPLGTCWYVGYNVVECAASLVERLLFISKVTRKRTRQAESDFALAFLDANPEAQEFVDIVKEYAAVFHRLILPSENVTRFLGNASAGNFRCTKGGFPSYRHSEDIVYMSRRNVNKETLSVSDFIPVNYDMATPTYQGTAKPSVDTPVQIVLYRLFPYVRYMIHAHVYIKDAPFTDTAIPCGALEEVDEIIKVVRRAFDNDTSRNRYHINLIGHGCLIMSSDLDGLRNVPFEARPLPELVW